MASKASEWAKGRPESFYHYGANVIARVNASGNLEIVADGPIDAGVAPMLARWISDVFGEDTQ